MTHIVDMTALTDLISSAGRALVLAGVAAFGLAAFRVKNTSLRLFTWTAVLYAALAMPLLGRLLPPLSIPTPAFLQSDHGASITAPERTSTTKSSASITVVSAGPSTITQSSTQAGATHYPSAITSTSAPDALPVTKTIVLWLSALQWNIVALAIYLAVLLALLSRFVIGIIFSHRLLHAAQEIRDPRLVDKVAFRIRTSRLSTGPRVAESSLVFVPVTVGAMKSTILLPADWRDWDDTTLDAVIAHEMSHVARRDALTQRLSLLHRAIFWFSPLSWWLDRHLAALAECASDEAALSCGTDRREYARTLLKFFEALQAAPGRIWWPGVSMAKSGQAEERVERILGWRGTVTMNLKKSLAVVVIAFAIPVVYLTASARPGQNHDWQDVDSAKVPVPPPPALAPMAPRAAVPALASDEAVLSAPAAAPVAAVAPGHKAFALIAPMATMAPGAPSSTALIAPVAPAPFAGQSGSYGLGSSYAYGFDDEQRFVIVTGNSDSLTMSGSTEDAHHVEKTSKENLGRFHLVRTRRKVLHHPRPGDDQSRPRPLGPAGRTWQEAGSTRKAARRTGKAAGSSGKQNGAGSRQRS